jgi:crotonobetainyl-CoA:carnitine CoA-transferase CaiB-like acyl-CoA transferase
LERHKIPCGPINNVKEVVESPQVQARGMIVEVEHPEAGRIKMAGSPIKASLTPPSVQSAPPLLGQDTGSVLSQLGYSPVEIDAFRAEGDI